LGEHRTGQAAAIRDDNPVVFLQAGGRGGEQGEVPDGEHVIPLGVAEVKRPGRDLSIVAIGSMVRPALRAAEELAAESIDIEVVDPRTLPPSTRARSSGRSARPADGSSSMKRATPAAPRATLRRLSPNGPSMR
jgi:transketolase C-terminal domain/subunit